MKNRIEKIFLNKKKKFVSFVTGGDPDITTSLQIIKSLAKNGSDIIEIGMPFSDPMADGPTIQQSSIRAIKNKIDLEDIFKISRNFRKTNDETPLILMGYYNIIFHYGVSKFVKKCVSNGIDGLIIVDLQPEEDTELLKEIKSTNLDLIRLITPTTNNERFNQILKNASGFLYYVNVTGTTGQHSANLNDIKKSILNFKKRTKLPIVSGFGIKNVKQVREICRFSDGVVVGSSIVNIVEKNYIDNKKNIIGLVSNFVKRLNKGTIS